MGSRIERNSIYMELASIRTFLSITDLQVVLQENTATAVLHLSQSVRSKRDTHLVLEY
jgi:hypothetical protein